MNKKQIRDCMAERKRNLSPETRAALSSAVLQQLVRHPRFVAASVVLLYHSLPDEVHTHDFVRHWATRKTVLLPVVKDDELELRQYLPDRMLAPGRFGILEPEGVAFDQFSAIDLAVIPCVAFDSAGRRLGRGKGYYDRLLARMNCPSLYKIGICFPFQQVESLPAEAHDIAMDEIIC